MSNQKRKGDAARKKKSSNAENNIQLDSSPKSAEEDDMITLTKSQLQALLSAFNTLGGFSPENQENENASVFGNIDTEAQESSSKPNDNYLKAARNRENNPVAESAVAGNDAQNLLTTSSKASRVTQKKMQWENEKRDNQEWNPWGRPGHGAPLERSVGVNGEIRHFRGPSPTSNQTDSAGGVSKFNNSVNHGSSTPVARVLPEQHSRSAPSSKFSPMALTSSVPLGESETGYELNLLREEGKKKWLAELEQQREEQRQRKGKEREEIRSSFGTPVSWKDNFEDSSAYRDMTSPTDPHENSRTYLRGQNIPVDPNVKEESDKKRQVATDYYRAVQAQVVEKERRKKEERLMQLKKEIEEEERLHKEQEEIKREFEMEQQRLKAKEESEEHKQKAIVEAMQRAKEEAEAAKLARRRARLQPNSAVNATDDHDCIHVKTDRSSPATVPQFVEQSASVTNKGAISCKGDGFRSPSRKCPPNVTRSSDENNQEDSYVANRILTPTAYRYRNEDATDMTCSREFGTQTDSSQVIAKENVGDAEEGNNVKHGSKYRKLERPQWGVNKANASYKKQSEKDPNYDRKRNARERRRMKSKVPADSDSTRSPTSSETHCHSRTATPTLPRLPRYSLPVTNLHDYSNVYYDRNETWLPVNNPSSCYCCNHYHNHHRCGLASTRRRWRSDESFPIQRCGDANTNRPFSPPRTDSLLIRRCRNNICYSSDSLMTRRSHPSDRKKWSDQGSYDLSVNYTPQLPRKQNDASSPKVQSADSGCADVGKHSESSSLDEQQRQATDQKNPITQPILMKGYPAPRQDRILQQLSDLRQGLLQRQIELQKLISATNSSTTKSTYR